MKRRKTENGYLHNIDMIIHIIIIHNKVNVAMYKTSTAQYYN